MTDSHEEIKKLLNPFAPITLEEMDDVKLMNRTDTKFVFERSLLPKLLKQLSQEYKVLSVDNNRISEYKTLYFDTRDFQFYMDHHNGKENRFKVRIRNYVESELFFLEIKNKIKGRTAKSRIRLEDFELELGHRSKTYVEEVMGEGINLEAKLWNGFHRITLVQEETTERLTLDIGLNFAWKDREKKYDHIVIAELKQERADRASLFYSLMKENTIRPSGMSKYCVGVVSLFSDIKYNVFKEKLLLIDKLALS